MKIKKKNLIKVIDNYLIEAPSGRADIQSWTMPSTGNNCVINISNKLQDLGLSQKASDRIQFGLSLIVGLVGLNQQMCDDFINEPAKLGRSSSAKSKKSSNIAIFENYIEKAGKRDWMATMLDGISESKFLNDTSEKNSVIAKWIDIHEKYKSSQDGVSYIKDFHEKVLQNLESGVITNAFKRKAINNFRKLQGAIGKNSAFDQLISELKTIMQDDPVELAIQEIGMSEDDVIKWENEIKGSIK